MKFTLSDHTTWMSELDKHGNKPTDWLAYLTLIENGCAQAEEKSRYRFLNCAYNRATKQIPLDKFSDDPDYSEIIIKFAHLKA